MAGGSEICCACWRWLQPIALGFTMAFSFKDNHIVAAGGIGNAVQRAREVVPHTAKIEIEIETLDQVDEALAAGADILLLDNMPPATMKVLFKRWVILQ